MPSSKADHKWGIQAIRVIICVSGFPAHPLPSLIHRNFCMQVFFKTQELLVWPCMTVALTSHFFCSTSHMSIAFLRCRIKLKEFQLFYTQRCSSMSVPKQWTNHRTLEAGQTLQAFVYSSKLATVLFDSNLVEEALIVAVSRYPELYNNLSHYHVS